MAMRVAARYLARRCSSGGPGGGKVLSEEEKALENMYIKKTEQEKLEKLAHKGPKCNASADFSPKVGGPVSSGPPRVSTSGPENVSTDKPMNYAVVGGGIAAIGALGWYLKGSSKSKHD